MVAVDLKRKEEFKKWQDIKKQNANYVEEKV